MTYQGIDTVASITAEQAANLRDNGVSFVARYLAPEGYYKRLSAEEAARVRVSGLAIMLCWEMEAAAMKGGAQRGAAHGAQARQAAESIGVPQGTTIYFAADYDVPSGDLVLCEQYILAAETALNSKYYAGIYGGERVCDFLFSRGSCRRVWQCCAWTNKFIDGATVIQYAWQGDPRSKDMAAACGIAAVDLDSAKTLRGMWQAQKEPWYTDTVAWALKEGIVTEARPEDFATRAEVMQMLRNYNRRFEAEDAKRVSGLIEEG